MTKTACILPEAADHHDAIDALSSEAFGPGRFARTAFRLREGTEPIPGLGFVALVDGGIVGSVRFSPITVGQTEALLLGPLVIAPAHKNRGHGLALMRRGLTAARESGHRAVILVGDEPYYARAGFRRVEPGRIVMPGPVDPGRLLVLGLEPGACEALAGRARPAPAGSTTLAVPGDRQRGEQERETQQSGEQRQ